MLYQVDIGYACFGVEVQDGKCINVAPIGKWMMGKSLDEITKWVINKKGKMVACQ
jgi:hypothetical protein